MRRSPARNPSRLRHRRRGNRRTRVIRSSLDELYTIIALLGLWIAAGATGLLMYLSDYPGRGLAFGLMAMALGAGLLTAWFLKDAAGTLLVNARGLIYVSPATAPLVLHWREVGHIRVGGAWLRIYAASGERRIVHSFIPSRQHAIATLLHSYRQRPKRRRPAAIRPRVRAKG